MVDNSWRKVLWLSKDERADTWSSWIEWVLSLRLCLRGPSLNEDLCNIIKVMSGSGNVDFYEALKAKA